MLSRRKVKQDITRPYHVGKREFPFDSVEFGLGAFSLVSLGAKQRLFFFGKSVRGYLERYCKLSYWYYLPGKKEA